MTHGSELPLNELEEEQRVSDFEEALAFGNHKGAEAQEDLFLKLTTSDVTHGYALPLPLEFIHLLKDTCMAPLNIQAQQTIDASGNIIGKDRLTHDQSWQWGLGTSVNSRVRTNELAPCMFGKTLLRLLNWTVMARFLFPGRRILASKIDIKLANRRCYLNSKTVLQSCTQIPSKKIALVALRLTFGGAPGPSEWGCISESICDLSNALLNNPTWDPLKLFAPQTSLVPPASPLPNEIPVAPRKELIVDLKINPSGFVDVYIDDFIGLTVDLPDRNNISRIDRATLLAIYTVARPPHPDEAIPHEAMAARNKLFAESGCTEIKLILGWLFDFRRLIISLPESKHTAWKNEAESLLKRGSATRQELITNLGRWSHLSAIIPQIHHFTSRLWDLSFSKGKQKHLQLTQNCIDDIGPMIFFLDISKKGLCMNTLAFRSPNVLYRSDSCPHGLGGYSTLGRAWRFQILENLLFRASNNLLDHIASIICPWIDIVEGNVSCGDCILSMTDSTTSVGWSHKTSFSDNAMEPIEASTRIAVARHGARLLFDNNIKQYCQRFLGIDNQVADDLSRDFDRDDITLTNILFKYVPSQMPHNFAIAPLPNTISSWLTSLLLTLPAKEGLHEVHTMTKIVVAMMEPMV